MATGKIAKGRARFGLVVDEKLVARVKSRALKRRMIVSRYAEKLLRLGLKAEDRKRAEGDVPADVAPIS